MIIFRADGSDKIGSGHLMRCMTIAGQICEKYGDKQKALFVTALKESAEFIRSKGFDAIVLGNIELNEELPEIIPFLEKEKPQWMFVDSYKTTAEYIAEVRKYTKVAYMDDFGEEQYPADMIVNYNVFADKEHYLKLYDRQDTRLLIGPGYIPIRSEFSCQKYTVKEQITDVLLLTGGGDYCHLSEKFIDTFGQEVMLSDIRFHLICGYYNERMDIIKEKALKHDNFIIYENVSNMGELMQRCDLALTAGGSTVYELCAVGVPFVGYTFADNQHPLMNYICEQKIAPYLGDYRECGDKLLEDMVDHIIDFRNLEKRNEIHETVRGFVDGQGALRIADALQKNL